MKKFNFYQVGVQKYYLKFFRLNGLLAHLSLFSKIISTLCFKRYDIWIDMYFDNTNFIIAHDVLNLFVRSILLILWFLYCEWKINAFSYCLIPPHTPANEHSKGCMKKSIRHNWMKRRSKCKQFKIFSELFIRILNILKILWIQCNTEQLKLSFLLFYSTDSSRTNYCKWGVDTNSAIFISWRYAW